MNWKVTFADPCGAAVNREVTAANSENTGANCIASPAIPAGVVVKKTFSSMHPALTDANTVHRLTRRHAPPRK